MFFRRANRLSADVYTSPGRFSLTLCTADRRPLLTRSDIVSPVRKTLRSEAAHVGIRIDAYCFMPDHMHILVTSRGADVRVLMKRFKQASEYWFRRSNRGRLWQKGYYDRVLRSDQDTERVVECILENPVRQGICQSWDEYPYSWSRWHRRGDEM